MTHLMDTITYNTERVSYWQSQPDFDYNRELLTPEVDVWQIINMWVYRILRKIFGNQFAQDFTDLVIILFILAVIVLVTWFIYKRTPELFIRTRRNRLAYEVHEDTIYGIDFERQIAQAESRGDFKEVVRLLYLQTLKSLSDEGKIDWQLYKTPTEYIYEIKADHIKKVFRELTTHFLRVRYGNFDAAPDTVNTVRNLQSEIRKGGSHES